MFLSLLRTLQWYAREQIHEFSLRVKDISTYRLRVTMPSDTQKLSHWRSSLHQQSQRSWSTFSRHNVPKKVLTDQGTNFTFQLLKELYRMIGVTHIKTTPYHSQTDGLVEQFNQTLKQMLQQVTDNEGRDWNNWSYMFLLLIKKCHWYQVNLVLLNWSMDGTSRDRCMYWKKAGYNRIHRRTT